VRAFVQERPRTRPEAPKRPHPLTQAPAFVGRLAIADRGPQVRSCGVARLVRTSILHHRPAVVQAGYRGFAIGQFMARRVFRPLNAERGGYSLANNTRGTRGHCGCPRKKTPRRGHGYNPCDRSVDRAPNFGVGSPSRRRELVPRSRSSSGPDRLQPWPHLPRAA